jgi:hypothetical protein
MKHGFGNDNKILVWRSVRMGMGELDESLGGTKNYYCCFLLLVEASCCLLLWTILLGLALGCSSKSIKIPFISSYVINSLLSKFTLNYLFFWIILMSFHKAMAGWSPKELKDHNSWNSPEPPPRVDPRRQPPCLGIYTRTILPHQISWNEGTRLVGC